jgi:FtsP/CotA-like multicopper oxidase with cupredoxin domain
MVDQVSPWRRLGNGSRRGGPLLLAVAALLLVFGSVPTGAQPSGDEAAAPQVCSRPTRSTTLHAESLGSGRIGYGPSQGSAAIPGPTLEMNEGECLAVRLVNHTDQELSFHPHGVDYTVASDGSALNHGCVGPGKARTYVIKAHRPFKSEDGTFDPGSAGYWHYHDHCLGTPHGTGGIDAGLFGALIVRRAGDPLPDREPFVVVMGPGTTIDLSRAPDTPIFEADEGERVEFVVIGHGNLFHTFHLHGHRWVDNRTGLPTSIEETGQTIDTRSVGPAESFGFQIVAGRGVGPGAWMYHCHVQNHSDLGMTGILLIRGPDGEVSDATMRVVEEWRHTHAAIASATGSHGAHEGKYASAVAEGTSDYKYFYSAPEYRRILEDRGFGALKVRARY